MAGEEIAKLAGLAAFVLYLFVMFGVPAIVGGLIGGAILGLFGIGGEGFLWTFLTAFLGAVLLLWLINAITGGRGIGKRARG